MLLGLEAYHPGAQSMQRSRQNWADLGLRTGCPGARSSILGLFLEKCKSHYLWGCHGGGGGPCLVDLAVFTAFFPKCDHWTTYEGSNRECPFRCWFLGPISGSKSQNLKVFQVIFFLKNLLLRYNLHDVKFILWACSYRFMHWVATTGRYRSYIFQNSL